MSGDGSLQAHDLHLSFDAASGELRVGRSRCVLRPRTASVLAALMAAPDQLLTKDELMRAAWPDAVVTDDSLTQCVKEIRKALGPAASRIRTVPRRGYIFLGDRPRTKATESAVRRRTALAAAAGIVVAAAAAWSGWQTWGRRATPPSSILVMPFATAGGAPAWMAVAVSDALVDELARLPQVRVIATGTASRLGSSGVNAVDAARSLGVSYVVGGTLAEGDGGFELTVRLADTIDGVQHWSDRLRVPRGALADTPSEVAARLTRALEVELASADVALAAAGSVVMPRTQERTLQAWASLNRGSKAEVLRARELFLEVVGADPRDSRAWIGLSHTYITSHVLRWPAAGQGRPDLALAADAMAKALSLEPNQLYARGTEGVIHALNGRLEEARSLLASEIAAYPSNAAALYWLSVVHNQLGDGRAGEAAVQRAIELSPRDSRVSGFHRVKAASLMIQGRCHDAVAEARMAVGTVNPHRLAYTTLAMALQCDGQADLAREAMHEFLARNPGYTLRAFMSEELSQRPEYIAKRQPFYDALVAAGLPRG